MLLHAPRDHTLPDCKSARNKKSLTSVHWRHWRARVTVSGSATGLAASNGGVDLVVTDSGYDTPLKIQSGSDSAVAADSIRRTAQPSAIVRRIAQLVTLSKTSPRS